VEVRLPAREPVNQRSGIKTTLGLVDIHAVFLILGYTIQGWVGFGFYFWAEGGNNTWRTPLALQVVWPTLLCMGLYWIPESPRWLMMNDRHEEAKTVLIRLHSTGKHDDNEYAATELYQIQKQIAIDKTLGSSWVCWSIQRYFNHAQN
jgi:hypothetical protein